jgi:dextranase
MHIADFYPAQGSFSPGQMVTFLIEIETLAPREITIQISIQHLTEQVAFIEQTLQLAHSEQITVHWTPPARPAGYSARLEVLSRNDFPAFYAATAFDVLSNWTDFPRYGFLTDFRASRADPTVVFQQLTRFHLNGLQFYDWQYRHDQLLAPTEDYIDPLGRDMSLACVRKLVDVAHQHGMAAMPYLAIYAASADFWRAHLDWALYEEAGNPIRFGEDFLGLMDPSAGSPWSEHLLAETSRALQNIPFDGLHIDQYGDPKCGWDSHQRPVDLPRAFVDFIQSASNHHTNKTILFNAVGNWPIDTLAESVVDFIYIEVWPPDVQYCHLAEIVLNAVRLSHGKAVVIALYLPASQAANNLLADAVILACGGTRIELGEDARLLSDPYFPKHEELSASLSSKLQELSEYAVRNGELLRPYTLSVDEKEIWSWGEKNPEFISSEEGIWTVARRYPKQLVIHLVNFTNLPSGQHWKEAHAAPTPCREALIKVRMTQRPSRVFWDCPEQTHGVQLLDFQYSNETLTIQVPHISFLGLIAIYE